MRSFYRHFLAAARGLCDVQQVCVHVTRELALRVMRMRVCTKVCVCVCVCVHVQDEQRHARVCFHHV